MQTNAKPKRRRTAPTITVTSTPVADPTIEEVCVRDSDPVGMSDADIRIVRDALAEPLPEPERPDAPKIKYVARLHAAIETLGRRSVVLAERIGAVLAPIKERLKHKGEWTAWCETHAHELRFKIDSADHYVAIHVAYRNDPKLPRWGTIKETLMKIGELRDKATPRRRKPKPAAPTSTPALHRYVRPIKGIFDRLQTYRRVTLRCARRLTGADIAEGLPVAKDILRYVAKIERELKSLRAEVEGATAAIVKAAATARQTKSRKGGADAA